MRTTPVRLMSKLRQILIRLQMAYLYYWSMGLHLPWAVLPREALLPLQAAVLPLSLQAALLPLPLQAAVLPLPLQAAMVAGRGGGTGNSESSIGGKR